jgi:predicted RNase H-like HicB family nuclease
MSRTMKVGDYLRVPYVVTAQSQPLPDGSWIRHVEHPELPGCVADADSITEALERLDQRRVHVVLNLLAEGTIPPTRKTLLGDAQARRRARRAGLGQRLEDVWDLDAARLSPDQFAPDQPNAGRLDVDHRAAQLRSRSPRPRGR